MERPELIHFLAGQTRPNKLCCVNGLAAENGSYNRGLSNVLKLACKNVVLKNNHVSKLSNFDGTDFVLHTHLVCAVDGIGLYQLPDRRCGCR